MTQTRTPQLPPSIHATRQIRRIGGTSWVVRPRAVVTGLALLLACVVLFIVGIKINEYPLSFLDVGRILLGGGRRAENFVVFDAALPRELVALLVGFGLALSGALTQTLTRNPLATPDILGITAGAGAAAVLAIAFSTSWGAWLADVGTPIAALIGGLATAAAMYVLAWPGRSQNGGLDPFRIVLVGVGITWLLQALTSYLLTRASVTDVAEAQHWLVGSVSQAVWADVWPALIAVVIGIGVVSSLSSTIGVYSLGTDVARGLGVATNRTTAIILLTAVVVAALSVSAAGPIAFVALLAPQVTMRLAGTATPGPIISGLTGSVLVLAADLLCRTVLPSGLPVGIVTAALGGPFLVYLMIRMSRRTIT
ncbi:putative iron-siderophore ABC transporter permease protein [Gordonia effusa NBRC 100432]|uniref:Putative iron-siderophore ABC transporter permease protein n=1 Tax=Gordonia effusa NBRC 100432 TaxID=1077974 RepID=H0R283_9ACTN|nr:iron ABC transporter permease [Gordonia effusa]GAB19184.1 putative iron-siderophore ABC transporter permease protein [Gordonia effusa NBRC 100432]